MVGDIYDRSVKENFWRGKELRAQALSYVNGMSPTRRTGRLSSLEIFSGLI